jgi:hypothetical protein
MLSIPLAHAQRTNASTTSSGKLAYCTMFWPRSNINWGVAGAILLRVRKPVKRILIQVSQTGIDNGSAPGFQNVKTHVVQDRRGREHLGRCHARGGHRLKSVAQHSVVEKDWVRAHVLLPVLR